MAGQTYKGVILIPTRADHSDDGSSNVIGHSDVCSIAPGTGQLLAGSGTFAVPCAI